MMLIWIAPVLIVLLFQCLAGIVSMAHTSGNQGGSDIPTYAWPGR